LQRRDSISQQPADERECSAKKIFKNRTLASFKKATETELWSRSNLGKLPDLKHYLGIWSKEIIRQILIFYLNISLPVLRRADTANESANPLLRSGLALAEPNSKHGGVSGGIIDGSGSLKSEPLGN
jgi:hypothetical protein